MFEDMAAIMATAMPGAGVATATALTAVAMLRMTRMTAEQAQAAGQRHIDDVDAEPQRRTEPVADGPDRHRRRLHDPRLRQHGAPALRRLRQRE